MYDSTPGDFCVVIKDRIYRLMWWGLAGVWTINVIDVPTDSCIASFSKKPMWFVQSIFSDSSEDLIWGCASGPLTPNITCLAWNENGQIDHSLYFGNNNFPNDWHYVGFIPCYMGKSRKIYCIGYTTSNQDTGTLAVLDTTDQSSYLLDVPIPFYMVQWGVVDSNSEILIGFDPQTKSVGILDPKEKTLNFQSVPVPSETSITNFVYFEAQSTVAFIVSTPSLQNTLYLAKYSSQKLNFEQFSISANLNVALTVRWLTGSWGDSDNVPE